MYSPERVNRLKEFCEVLTENAIKQRRRIQVVHGLRKVALYEHIEKIVSQVYAMYPNYSVEVNLIDDVMQYPVIVPASIKKVENTFCRYVIAGDAQFETTDPAEDLVVCESPYLDNIKAYLGSPIVVYSQAVGVLCIHTNELNSSASPSWQSEDRARIAEWAIAISHIFEQEMKKSGYGE